MQATCDYMCYEFDADKDFDLVMVNSGAAWVRAREAIAKLETSLIPVEGGLCARTNVRNEGTFPYFSGNKNAGDGYHDGDIGGAQLLNAYVWYMTITGDRDLSDSTYEPTYTRGGETYTLTKEHIAMLKEAAMSVFEE